jgi:hypothetical protein
MYFLTLYTDFNTVFFTFITSYSFTAQAEGYFDLLPKENYGNSCVEFRGTHKYLPASCSDPYYEYHSNSTMNVDLNEIHKHPVSIYAHFFCRIPSKLDEECRQCGQNLIYALQ